MNARRALTVSVGYKRGTAVIRLDDGHELTVLGDVAEIGALISEAGEPTN
jgi:hypothetical protein